MQIVFQCEDKAKRDAARGGKPKRRVRPKEDLPMDISDAWENAVECWR